MKMKEDDDMRLLKQNHGFSILEAVASVVIVTLVFTTAIAMITAMRNQTIATEQKRLAVEVASRMRNDMINNITYEEASSFLQGEAQTINIDSCATIGSVISCDYFDMSDRQPFSSSSITVTFLSANSETIKHRIIHFEISINYYKTRSITIVGAIYAS